MINRSCLCLSGSIDKLDELIKYIENNLDKDLNYKSLAKILCVNEYSLHRIFYFVTNISLSEYIRKRRLTVSCTDLLNGDKVIDVSIKYGYDSPTSFGRAFKKMMGFSPKDIFKNKDALKAFPVFDFTKVSKASEDIRYSIVKNMSFNLFSVSRKTDIENIPQIASSFWNEMLANGDFIFSNKRYGIVEYDKFIGIPRMATYHIASTYNFKGSKPYTINNKTFLKFSIESREATDISKFTNMIYTCIIPYLKYNLDTIPDIEEYVGKTTTNIYISILQ